MIKQIICINWGTKYGADYVNRLFAMVERNITPPFTFTCFTDNAQGIRADVLCEDLPDFDVPMPVNTPGKWPKSRLWGPKLGTLSGPVLFIDLDVVIKGNLDVFFETGDPDQVMMSVNPSTPFEKLGQTSLFRFPVGKLVGIQEKFANDPQGMAEKFRFEQRYVTRNAPDVAFFPRKLVAQFSHDLCYVFPLNYFLAPRYPEKARVVIFAGASDPTLAIKGLWSHKYTAKGALAHLRGAFSKDRPDKFWRYIRHYVKPSPWVEKFWQE